MASAEPLIDTNEDNAQNEEPLHKWAAKIGGACCCGVFWTIFLLVWIWQGFLYTYATTMQGCKASSLEGFNYDGDADPSDNPTYNLMPRMSLLIERQPWFWGEAFYVFPSNEANTIAGGQVGTWWRTWGPIFETYTYEDMSSKTIIYMRRNLLRLGSSHRIARCDGKGPFVTFTEGSNFFGNRIRAMLGYNQAMSFKIYNDDDEVGVAEESAGDVPSLIFRSMHNDLIATSVLADRYFHGNKHEWIVKINNRTQKVPFFVHNAATLLFAFHNLAIEQGDAPPVSAPTLAAMPGSSGVRTNKQQQQESKHVPEHHITDSSALAVNHKIMLNSTAIARGSRAASKLRQQVPEAVAAAGANGKLVNVANGTPKAPVMVEQHV